MSEPTNSAKWTAQYVAERFASFGYEGDRDKAIADAFAEKDAEIATLLDSAGVPIGNEHETYTTQQRMAWLISAKDSCWRTIDREREELASLRQQLEQANLQIKMQNRLDPEVD